MNIKMVPQDRDWIVPILIALFLIEGFILITKPGLGGFLFLGSIFYFMFFIITDIVAKQKDIDKKTKFKPKRKMCYDY